MDAQAIPTAQINRGLSFDELPDDGCRYPFGDNLPYLFCADAQLPGSSYCPEHHKLCCPGNPSPLAKPRKYFGTDFGGWRK